MAVALLALAAAAASASPADASAGGHPVPHQAAAADAVPADPGSGTEREESDDPASRRQQTLSTLGALMLGVLGLLWMRRHVAEH